MTSREKVLIELDGCDGTTYIEMEVTAEEMAFLDRVSAASLGLAKGCDPTLAIKPVVEDLTPPQVLVTNKGGKHHVYREDWDGTYGYGYYRPWAIASPRQGELCDWCWTWLVIAAEPGSKDIEHLHEAPGVPKLVCECCQAGVRLSRRS